MTETENEAIFFFVEQQRNQLTYFVLRNKLLKLILNEQFWEVTVILEAVYGLNPNWINKFETDIKLI